MNYEDRVTKEYIENALANAGSKIVVGTYTGDGEASQFINLGFTPRAVYVCLPYSSTVYQDGSGWWYYGGLALLGHPLISRDRANVLEITDGGFIVHYGYSADARHYYMTNDSYNTYYYVAIG